ncbi:DNA helicase HerA-like ATPase [Salinibacterium sp. CAN_S4]|uniref:helicase HerA-like domain-containing protein n=1 Tax=Salinibacterium sp. CAN_S4 TaxID=2787727 RepID=UPI0018EFAA14
MTDAAALVEAAKKALADAEAALAAEQAAPAQEAPEAPAPSASPARGAHAGPLSPAQVDVIRAGYTFDAPALEMGALVNGDPLADVPVRIPLAMVNRHGLVAGATGTGKTKTLQVLAEQLSAAGVPVFAADIKGDLSGIASEGTSNPKLLDRTASIGQHWAAAASPTEYFTLGGLGTGIPIRATVSSFGPLLLSKVLGLNETQESSLGLVFHYADRAGLPLVDLSDLRAVLKWLTSEDGKPELKDLGGLSSATAGVILRELIGFSDQGADVFFGEPEIDTSLFLRTTADGKGIVSLLEIPGVQDKPAVFSTFLMWLLADLFNDLPEVGDIDKPKLVFFFDEAHLLFNGASDDFIASITQTVRLIRSKGVGIFFVTQTPKDVPSEVLAQIGSRVQHQLRAHTPDDAKALRATVSTYPTSGYDLKEVLTTLATGEAIITVMNEKGAPSPVAWTRLRAPQGSMSPTPIETMQATVSSSPLLAQFGTPVDRESAREMLAVKMNAAAAAIAQVEAQKSAAQQAKEAAKAQADYDRAVRDMATSSAPKTKPRTTTRTTTRPRADDNPIGDILGSRAGQTVVREVLRGIFSTLKRR